MTIPGPAELPQVLADLPIERIEKLEAAEGRGFGAMLAEMTSGQWSIGTMRAILGAIDPDRELVTMADLMAAAEELLSGKAPPGPTP